MTCVFVPKLLVIRQQITTGNAIQYISFTIRESEEKKNNYWDMVNTTTAGIALRYMGWRDFQMAHKGSVLLSVWCAPFGNNFTHMLSAGRNHVALKMTRLWIITPSGGIRTRHKRIWGQVGSKTKSWSVGIQGGERSKAVGMHCAVCLQKHPLLWRWLVLVARRHHCC